MPVIALLPIYPSKGYTRVGRWHSLRRHQCGFVPQRPAYHEENTRTSLTKILDIRHMEKLDLHTNLRSSKYLRSRYRKQVPC